MKKALFFLAIAALALTACNKVETLEVNRGSAINFRTFASPLTRASSTQDVTTANIASFNVTAFNAGGTTNPYIDDVTYSKNSSNVFWVDPDDATYSSEYYWPANNLDFYAYSWKDGDDYFGGNQVAQASSNAYKSFTYTPSQTANAAYPDLVVATIQNIGKNDSYSTGTYGSLGIPLNFRHAASKIAVKVKNTSATLNFDIDSWKVGYLDDSGTFTLNETSTVTQHTNAEGTYTNLLAFSDWTNNTTAAVGNEYVSTFTSTDAKHIAAGDAETALPGEMILVPQGLVAATAYATGDPQKLNGTFLAVKLIIRNSDTAGTIIYGDKSGSTPATLWAIWPIGGTSASPFNWEPGKKYTYTIDLAGGGYYETNQDANADLDPILENTLIRFVDVTVDQWQDYDYDSTTTGVQPIPVSGPVNS